MQPERDRDGQHRGHQEGGPGQPERRPAEPFRPHVLPGQEEQEAQAQQVQHLGRALGPDQAQDLRADHDSRQHFEHHRRDQPPRHQAGDQRGHERRHRHHEQPAVLDRHLTRPPVVIYPRGPAAPLG